MRYPAVMLIGLLPLIALAAPEQSDWPCVQPLVPQISAEMIWQGPKLAGGEDWRSDRKIAALVEAISPEAVDPDEGNAQLRQFLRHHHQTTPRGVARIFTGLLDETNSGRARVIDHLKMLAERQRGLADIVTRLGAERDEAGSAAESELIDRLNFAQRTYYETQRMLRYACEIPARLDRRLGIYAKTLQGEL